MTEDSASGAHVTQELQAPTIPAVGRGLLVAGASRPIGARLVELMGAHAGRGHRIEGDEVILGREVGVGVYVEGDDISRRHARLWRGDDGGWSIEDLGSRNGLSVNGKPVAQSTLVFGDHVQLGASALFVFTYHDQLEEQILQVQRMESLGSLAGGVAHDFNNLLAVLLGNVDFLERRRQGGNVDHEVLGECLAEMRDAAKHAEGLIHRLLSFSRPSGGGVEAVDCVGLIREAVGLCRRTFAPTVTLDAEVDPALWIHGDLGQFNQVLMNLLINARDAMPEGGRILVRGQIQVVDQSAEKGVPFLASGRYVRIDVEDSGVGMDGATQARVFEPFFTTKATNRGTGLGLSTVYALARKHGGHVQVASEPGVGTTFTVFLPAVAAPAAVHPATAPVSDALLAEAAFFRSPMILLVDDDVRVRRTMGRLLREMDYEVLDAASGEEALEVFSQRRNDIDLVLLDVWMPGLDGAKAFARLREEDSTVRVVMMSGGADEEQVGALVAAGARGFLPKPVGASALRAMLDGVLA